MVMPSGILGILVTQWQKEMGAIGRPSADIGGSGLLRCLKEAGQ